MAGAPQRTVLITGGAGFIGSHLAERCLARGARVLVLDDLSGGTLANLAFAERDPRLSVTIGSVRDQAVLSRLVREADQVYHLAASVGVATIAQDPVGVVETMLHGTSAVLAACAEHRRPVFLASSSEVYGKSTALPFVERQDLVLGPTTSARWSYACAKAAAEFLGLAYGRQHGVRVVIGRYFNVAGPRQTGRYGMVIPRFVEAALAGRDITVYGDGAQTRCFCHVADIADATRRLMSVDGASGEPVNLGGDRPISIRALAETTRRMAGSTSAIVQIPFEAAYEPGFEDLAHRRPDLGRARALIGFAPRKSLEDILRDTIAEHRIKPGTADAMTGEMSTR